jgi:DNA processing protein
MKVNTLYNQDEYYQKRLLGTPIESDVYYIGTLPKLKTKTVGIIGTRRPTSYGIAMTKTLTEGLRGYDINVISGLAIGIDSLAHRQALACGIPTTAVVPTDLEHIYPPRHKSLAEQIIHSGGGIATLKQDLPLPWPIHFYERNQLLAAMCDVIVVVEAAKRSGTMITVRFGLDIGKTVLALPGRVGDVMSTGTNILISQGAQPVLSAQDIIEALNLTPKQQALFLDDEQAVVFGILDKGISDINQIQSASKFDAQHFNSLLTDMELDGIIRIEAGHIYKRGLA